MTKNKKAKISKVSKKGNGVSVKTSKKSEVQVGKKSMLQHAEEILKSSSKPLVVKELMERIFEKGWQSKGLTPLATLNAKLCVDNKKENPKFQKVSLDGGKVAWTVTK